MAITPSSLTPVLLRSLDHPSTAPGSEGIARRVLGRFPASPVPVFAEKLAETARDGQMHSRIVLTPPPRSVAVAFVAWSGTARERHGVRYGTYLSEMARVAAVCGDRLGALAGFLQIDAFVAADGDGVRVEVEYSYLPGAALGTAPVDDGLPRAMLVNGDLCTAEEREALQELARPR